MNNNAIYNTDDLVLGDIVRVYHQSHVYGKPSVAEYPISFNQVLLRRGNKYISILGDEYDIISKEENGTRVKNVISINEFFEEDFARNNIVSLSLAYEDIEMLEYMVKNLSKEDVFDKFIEYYEIPKEIE